MCDCSVTPRLLAVKRARIDAVGGQGERIGVSRISFQSHYSQGPKLLHYGCARNTRTCPAIPSIIRALGAFCARTLVSPMKTVYHVCWPRRFRQFGALDRSPRATFVLHAMTGRCTSIVTNQHRESKTERSDRNREKLIAGHAASRTRCRSERNFTYPQLWTSLCVIDRGLIRSIA
jgi:hypothetical protein